LEKGTGLEGVDFIYCEQKTGLDAVFLMAVAAHESAWGSNSWAKNYNNIMSLGITSTDPDRTKYASKTLNVLITAQWLLRGYLTVGAPYYKGGLTQWEIGQSYASDGSWARGVTAMITSIESRLSEEQRMRRLMVKTGTFQPDVVWDYTHEVVGWSLYKIQNNKTIAGR
jgi:beta-N-acetylglucosaminidase